MKTVDPVMVTDLVAKLSILIEDRSLRQELTVEAGRYEIDSGRFSMAKRNRLLKDIFDEATS